MKTNPSQAWFGKAKSLLLCGLLICSVTDLALASGPPPVITVQPTNIIVQNGGTAAFSVTASSGTALSYQWYYSATVLNITVKLPIYGATNANFTLSNVTFLSAANYYVAVMNAGGTVISSMASLTVTQYQPPRAGNDMYYTPENVPLNAGVISPNVLATTTSTTYCPSNVLSNDSDSNGNSLSAMLVTNVTNGTLAFNTNGTFTYSPNADFIGIDTFYYVANDGVSNSAPASVTIYVNTALLTIFTNGFGAIEPHQHSIVETVGQSFHLNANPGSGCVFSNWTDAFGNVIGTSNSQSFIMTTNLSITANFFDNSKPNLSLDSPQASTSTTNLSLLVTGRASDNIAVATVRYSLNGGLWLTANTTNNFANWSATITPTYATNSLAVYALDTSGNASTTNYTTITLPTSILTVSTNGYGSITPALNGSRLAIGQSYTLTAVSSAAGIVFTNWVDQNTNVVGINPSITFVMTSNLSLTANFVDLSKPTLTISNLTSNNVVSNALLTVTGTAGDNLAVTGVYYNLNQAGWVSATSVNGWTNWSAIMSLSIGTNSLAVFAAGVSGDYSATNVVNIICVATSTLTVSTNGPGTISPALNGSVIRNGQSVSLTATAKTGCVFTNWSNVAGIITNKATLTFIVSSNVSLTANFLDVTKPTLTVVKPLAAAGAILSYSYSNEFVLVSGKSSDNIGVSSVIYQINGGASYAATTTNSWTNWFVTLDLQPGSNTFSVCSVDVSGNLSATMTLNLIYATAPTNLGGMRAVQSLDSTDAATSESAFGTATFSQLAKDTNSQNGVGNYTFTKSAPNLAILKMTYSAPPLATNAGPQWLQLAFSAPGVARYTNLVSGVTGSIRFSPASKIVPTTLSGKSVVYVGSSGQGKSNSYTASSYSTKDLQSGLTNFGTRYTYTTYSPVSALLRQTDTNGLTYVLTTFTGTNYGVTYSESYTPGGTFNASDVGFFGIASQSPGGNAPTNVQNLAMTFLSGAATFRTSFSSNTFAQFSSSEGYDTGVGNYNYTCSGTNFGYITLGYLLPASIAGGTNSTALIFFANNLALYTNGDGTIGSAVLGTTASLAPTTLSGHVIMTTNYAASSLNQFTFNLNSTFSISGYLNGSGNFTAAAYSRDSVLAQLTFTAGNLAGDSATLQLDYASASTGRYYLSVFDLNGDLLGTSRGTFGQP